MTRTLRALIALAFAVLGVTVIAPPPAFACSCQNATLPEMVERSDAVFRGTVAAIAQEGTGPEAQNVFTVHADTVWAGEVPYESQVRSIAQPSLCGLADVAVGSDFVLFVTGQGATFQTGLCSGSRPASAENVVRMEKLLGEGTTVEAPPPPQAQLTQVEESPPSGFARLAAPGAAVVVIGLLGLLLVGRLSRR